MAAVKCIKFIESRAKRGKDSNCGKPAAPYRLIGGISHLPAAFCEKHAPAFQQSGYRLERPDGTTLPKAESNVASPSAQNDGDDTADQLPLFGDKKRG